MTIYCHTPLQKKKKNASSINSIIIDNEAHFKIPFIFFSAQFCHHLLLLSFFILLPHPHPLETLVIPALISE